MYTTACGLNPELKKYRGQHVHDLLIQNTSIQNRFEIWFVPLQIHTLGGMSMIPGSAEKMSGANRFLEIIL